MAGSKLSSPKQKLTNALVWFHRWISIATCLIFAAWFASGAVLLFQPFPSLPKAVASGWAAPVDRDEIRIAPSDILARLPSAIASLKIVQRGEHPAYIASGTGGDVALDASTGAMAPLLTARQAKQIAERALGRATRSVHGPFEYDQWVVHNQFDSQRPFYRIDIGDDVGTTVYLSAITGEFVQRATSWARGWTWLGAVLHWAYFTPLRASFSAWDQTVWWLSFVSMWGAVAGIVLGLIRTMTVRRAGRGGLTYFRLKWLRWHHLLGLFVSVFVITYIFSGWLSMDHGRLFSRGQTTAEEVANYAGIPLDRAVSQISPQQLQVLPSNRAIGFSAIGGKPLLILSMGDGHQQAFDLTGKPVGKVELEERVRGAISNSWPKGPASAGSRVPATDVYALAEGLPDTAERYVTGDGATSVFVDGESGRILTVMNGSRAAYAWVYYALHTFNFPGLIEHPIVRDVLVLTLMLFGFLFSITGVVIGYQRLCKSL